MRGSSSTSYGFLKATIRGFTLLELITVVAITAIMVTIGVAQLYGKYPQQPLDDTSQ